MAMKYIDCVKDEEFLTMMMLEKDFTGRDTLKIVVDLELLMIV